MMDITNILMMSGGALIASTLAAVTGFGGAAVLLPILVIVFGVRDAIPILTVAQLIGNGSRVWFNRRELALPVVGWFALGGVPAALVGGVLFATAPLSFLKRLLGLFLLATVVYRRVGKASGLRPSLRGFAIIGAIFSFLSALVGSVGPIMIFGSFIGKKILDKIPERIFVLIIEATLIIAGLGFLIRG